MHSKRRSWPINLARFYYRKLSGRVDYYLPKVYGLIHVGAHYGEERFLYDCYDMEVLWIEPMPKAFGQLTENISNYRQQRAVRYLATDTDDKEYELHISSNDGLSSSVLELGGHKALYPDVDYVDKLKLRGTTIDTIFARESINIANYNALCLDTQGSELLVLNGATSTLKYIRFIQSEVADFQAYKGCCVLNELDTFLGNRGFQRQAIEHLRHEPGVGGYHEAVYERVRPS